MIVSTFLNSKEIFRESLNPKKKITILKLIVTSHDEQGAEMISFNVRNFCGTITHVKTHS